MYFYVAVFEFYDFVSPKIIDAMRNRISSILRVILVLPGNAKFNQM